MDLAKGIRAFISGREMILSLTVDTFIVGDEWQRTYQDGAAVSVICGRGAGLTRRGPAPIKPGLGCQSEDGCYSLLRFRSNVTKIRVISWLIASRSLL